MRARRKAKDERETDRARTRRASADHRHGTDRPHHRRRLDRVRHHYAAVEKNQKTFAEANADGYKVVFGDAADPRIWEPLALHDRKIAVITAPDLDVSSELTPITSRAYPQLRRFAVVGNPAERDAFVAAGIAAIIDRGEPPGLDIAAAVLRELGIDEGAVRQWAKAEKARTAEAYATAEAAE